MMKLCLALALAAAPSALAFTHYVPNTDEPTPAPTPELNGCGEPCADVVTIDKISGTFFDAIEDNKCYVFDGTFFLGEISVPEGVNCAKITVPSDSTRVHCVRAKTKELKTQALSGSVTFDCYGNPLTATTDPFVTKFCP